MQELKDMRIWFLWRRKINGGRINKIPFAASGSATGTNERYRHTWVTYDEAVAAMKEQNAAGVGFVIPKGYFFLDIDHYDLTDPFVNCCLSGLTPMPNARSAAGHSHLRQVIWKSCQLS